MNDLASPLGEALAAYDEFGQPQSERRFDPTYPQGYSYFGFTGEPYDLSTGFTYLRNRQYAPGLGRFTSPDPLGVAVGDPMSLNAYVYALSNPLKWIDPLGLSPVDASPMVAATGEANVSTGYVGGFVKGFLKTAGAAAVGIVAFAAAPVATAVIGAGLAVYGTVTNYQQRAAEQTAAGQKVNKVGTFFTALGDTLGVTGLIEGVTGKRLLTGTQLTASQAGEKMGSGVASVAAMVAGPALVKTIKPVVSKIVEPIKAAVVNAVTPIKNAVGSFFSKIGAGLKALVADETGGASVRSSPKWPATPEKMDDFLGFEGERIPDKAGTPGRNKVVWRPSENTKITYEQHPYDTRGNPQPSHTGPHWHLQTPTQDHVRFLPGERIPRN